MTTRETELLTLFFSCQRATPSKTTCPPVKSTEISTGRYYIQGNAEMITQDTSKDWVTRPGMCSLCLLWVDEAHLCPKGWLRGVVQGPVLIALTGCMLVLSFLPPPRDSTFSSYGGPIAELDRTCQSRNRQAGSRVYLLTHSLKRKERSELGYSLARRCWFWRWSMGRACSRGSKSTTI